MQLNVSDDISIGAGNDYAVNAVRQIGMGAGDILALAAVNQIQTKAENGTFIKDSAAVQITSTGGAYPSFIWNKGYKAGVFSSTTDVIIGAGGKNLLKTDGGTEVEAGTTAGVGKILPS